MSVRTPTLERSLTETFPRLLGRGRLGRRPLDELEALVGRAREFADVHVRPRALEIDRLAEHDARYFDWDVVRAGARCGLLRLLVPKPAGGAGGLSVEASLVMEELSAACPGIANIFGAHALGISPLLVLGGVAHWDHVLREVVEAERAGEPTLMGLAITEPGAGTDVEDPDLMRRSAIATRARQVPGGYRLSGVKHFISNGSVARWLTVFMPLDPRHPAETLTCFLVDARSEGYSVGLVEHKLGQRACPAAELVFDDVFVPDEHVLGREGDGMAGTMMVLTTSRPAVGAIATGIARGAYERLLAWLERDARGLLERQEVQLLLARMEEEIHLARQAYMDAATELDVLALGGALRHPLVRAAGRVPAGLRGNAVVRRQLGSARARDAVARTLRATTSDRRLSRALALSSLAKARGADTAMRVTDGALSLVGLTADPVRAELEKLWRDAKLTQIYEGTNQLNRLEVYRGLCRGESLAMLPRAPGHVAMQVGAAR